MKENLFECLLCPNKYNTPVDLWHHMQLEHKGIERKLLQEATHARETKKQLGEYVGPDAKGVNFECPECFELFSDLDKLNDHRKQAHKMQFTDAAEKKLKEFPHFDENNPPQCEKCNLFFCGLVVCSIEGKAWNVCFNCYANYYGENALRQLTIGTPDEMIVIMRKPLSK